MNLETYYVLNYIYDGSTVLLLCWVRVWVVFKVVPFFGGPSLPAMVRNAVTVSFALVLFPLVSKGMQEVNTSEFFWFVSIIFKEAFLGFIIGYSISLMFWAIGGIGFFIDNQRGASMASSFNPLLGDQDSPLGIFLTQVLVTLLFVTGGIFSLFDGIYTSYVVWPPTSYFPTLDILNAVFFLKQLDKLMYLIVFLSGPVIVCMFIAEFGLALIGRFAPQLNVFFLAMPIKSGIALFVLAIYLYLLMEYFTSDYTAFSFIPEELYEAIK